MFNYQVTYVRKDRTASKHTDVINAPSLYTAIRMFEDFHPTCRAIKVEPMT